jgi:hypothetical protein
MPTTLDPSILSAALEGLEQQQRKIDEQIREVRSMLGHRRPGRPAKNSTPETTGPVRKRRSMSASAKRRIAAAQKKRWAEYHKQQKAGA